mmetsp:Transcript_31344/g.87911  ORF Transcript_31344/g.87911 Transcript_31344/m.87911 type:complete len:211 (+) Transcript_31344:2589-3221(+)
MSLLYREVPRISITNPATWRMMRCQHTSSHPLPTANIQMKIVRHASMVALDDPLRCLVTMIPKKLKNAMEMMDIIVVTVSCVEAWIWDRARGKLFTESSLVLTEFSTGRAMMQMQMPQNPSSPTATFAGTWCFDSTFSSTMNCVAAASWARNTSTSPNRTSCMLSLPAPPASIAPQSSAVGPLRCPGHLTTLAVPTKNAPRTMANMPTQW